MSNKYGYAPEELKLLQPLPELPLLPINASTPIQEDENCRDNDYLNDISFFEDKDLQCENNDLQSEIIFPDILVIVDK